jgi:[ribosomal protein S5]-alanine N-acetyltransferase
MFELDTDRLRIIALDLENLRLCRIGRQNMERNLRLSRTVSVLSPELEKELGEALEIMIDLVEEDRENCLWNTTWEIVLKEENRIIGGCCFQGPPDNNGDVQVGYVLQPNYRRRGFMSEALAKLVEWAFEQPDVKGIIAETDRENLPSQRVLKRLGLSIFRETEKTVWWRIKGKE